MEIHEKIKLFLVQKGIAAKTLAEEYGASQQTISNYLNGQNAMPLSFLVWLYEKFQKEIDLVALFEQSQTSIVSEPNTTYKKSINKKRILEKVAEILDQELHS